MIHIYRIHPDPAGPKAEFAVQSRLLSSDLGLFDGRQKGQLSPDRPFQIVGAGQAPCDSFVGLVPGVLVIDSRKMAECMDVYYVLAFAVEHIWMTDGDREFTAVNPLEYLPPPARGTAPCVVDRHYMPVFRIAAMQPTELFTATGFLVPENEFKPVYEMNGLKGLIFEPVWSGESY